MARFVLSAGCGNYDNGDRLPGAINDAEDLFHVLLEERLGGATSTGSVLLLDPTAPQLVEEISKFFSRLTSTDEYFLFFSGHAHQARTGYAFRCRNTPPKSAFEALSFRELKILVSRAPARGTLIFDTCYSGEVRDMVGYVARGEEDDEEESQPPEAPREGTILIWSCDSKAKAFENREHGVFSECLLEGIRSGTNLPTTTPYVTAGRLVSTIRERLMSQKYEGSLPGLRMAGDVAGMFVSNNPKYAIGSPDGPSVVSESIVTGNPLLTERSCKGIRELANSLLRQETKLHSRRSTNPHPLQAHLFFVPTLGSEVYCSQTKDSTVLITENGFYHLDGSTEVIFVWDAVDSTETSSRSHSPSFDRTIEKVTINFRPGVTMQDQRKYYAIADNRHPLLGQAIEWGRSYKKSGWKWNLQAPKPAVHGREIALFAPLTYDSMRTIPASASDASEIARAFHVVTPALNPASAFDFRSSLRAVFQSAHHKTLILYYSGHGILLGNDLFLTAQRTAPSHPLETAVPIFKLFDLMSEYQVINLVLILDCCYSGAAGDNLGVSFDLLEPSLEALYDTDRIGITVIASSGRSEESFDKPTQSIFTDAIVKACSLARSENSRVTVGDLISAIHKVMSDPDQRMRVFVSQQGQEIVLADEVEDASNLERAQIEARLDTKTDQVWKLKQIDFRLHQGQQCISDQVSVFRKTPNSLGMTIYLLFVVLFLGVFTLPVVYGAVELVRERHGWFGWFILPCAVVFALFTFGLPAWMFLTDTAKDHYMILGGFGVLIREGKSCVVVPALSLMSIQVSKSHHFALFKGSVSEQNHTRHALIRDDAEPVDLPIWLDDSSTDLAIKGINKLIESASRNLVSSGQTAPVQTAR